MHCPGRHGDLYDVSFEVGGMHFCSKSTEEEEAENGDWKEQSRGQQAKITRSRTRYGNIKPLTFSF